jgi:hypothetical protein
VRAQRLIHILILTFSLGLPLSGYAGQNKGKARKSPLITPARKAQHEYQATLKQVREARLKREAEQVVTEDERKARERLGDEYLKTIEWLDQVETQLLHEFVGWDEPVRRMMSAASKIILNPESGRTQVVPLISFPGYGKTTIIQRFLELLKWEDRFIPVNVQKGQTHIPHEGLLRLAELDKTENNPLKPQAVMLIDEIQNLARPAAIEQRLKDEEADFRSTIAKAAEKGTANLSKFEKPIWYSAMEPSRDFFWQILGNGQYQPKARRPITELMTALNANLSGMRTQFLQTRTLTTQVERQQQQIAEKKREIENGLAPAGMDSAQYLQNLRNQLVQLENNLPNLETQVGQYQANLQTWDQHFIPTLHELLADHSDSLGDWKGLTPEELFEIFKPDPAAFMSRLRRASTQFIKPQDQDFSRTIIFVTANPEEIIDRVKTNLGENASDPNALHAAASQVRDKDIVRWFDELMGKEPGLHSRWNIKDWKIIAPFNADQWHQLTNRRLEQFAEKFTARLEKRGQPATTLAFHQSVHDLIYKACVDPLQGPRNFFPKSANLLWTVVANVTADLMRLPKEHRPAHLVATFNSQTSQIEIYEYVPEGEKRWRVESFASLLFEKVPPPMPEGWHVTYPIGVDTRDKPVIHKKSDSLALRRQTVHQAGQAVVGMVLFKSLPQQISRNLAPGETGILEMWAEPDLRNHDYQRKLLLTVLGGYVAAHRLLGKLYVSEPLPGDLASAQDILKGMMQDLQRRREILDFLAPDAPGGTIHDVVPAELARQSAYDDLLGDREQAALKALYREAEQIVLSHEKLIGAIANRLRAESEIEPEELRAIVTRYMRTGFFFTKDRALRNAIVYSTPGDAQFALPKSLNREYRYGKLSWWEELKAGLGF